MEELAIEWLKQHKGVLTAYVAWWCVTPLIIAGLKAGWNKYRRPRWVKIALAVMGARVNAARAMMAPAREDRDER